MPSRVETAACAANCGPRSRNSSSEIGPDVSGSPTIQPPAAGPHTRIASVAPVISRGVIASLSHRVVITSPFALRFSQSRDLVVLGVGLLLGATTTVIGGGAL